MKILLVDDEMLVRNHIKLIIDSKKSDYKICGEARNGKEAIKLINEQTPNIVIFDISMPVMDGVELSSYIKENHKDIKMIALSSYDDFKFVKETMKNGAIDYILKHELRTDELFQLLGKTKEKILSEMVDKQKYKNALMEVDVLNPLAINNYIRNLALKIQSNSSNNSKYMDYMKKKINLRNMVLVVMQVSNYYIITKDLDDFEKSRFLSIIRELTIQALGDNEESYVVYIKGGRFALLLSFKKYRSQAKIHESINAYISKIREVLIRYENIKSMFKSSELIRNPLEISKYYKKLSKDFELNSSRDSSKHDSISNNIITLSIEQEKNLLTAIGRMDIEEVNSIIKDIFHNLKKNKAGNKSTQMITTELIHVSKKVAQKEEIALEECYDYDKVLNSFVGVDDYEKWVKNIYNSLIEKMSCDSIIKYNSYYVVKVKNYIEMNYHKDISLNDMAAMVGINSSYLSSLFKTEMKMSFVEYLNSIRIKQAKKIMKRGNIKIKEVYKKVGFNGYNYFFKVFKAMEEMTPNNYVKSIVSKRENYL